jgi:hypothetical protein
MRDSYRTNKQNHSGRLDQTSVAEALLMKD